MEINIGSSEALKPAGSVAALAGKGLRGDRHFCADGAKPGQALTLIEAEALEDVGLTGAQSRRQVVVRGVRLNDLAGRGSGSAMSSAPASNPASHAGICSG